jgi:omega-amidase
MEVIGLQWDLVWENKEANYAHARRLLKKAGPERDSLVVLPEMFATGFSMNVAGIAEEEGGPTPVFLSEMAREFRVFVIGGVVLRDPNGRGRNEALVMGPGGEEIGRYCKLHPFRMAGETEHYQEGVKSLVVRWGEFTVSPFICYDLRFPEVFRSGAARGAEVIVVIASWPAARVAHWRALLQARAIENQAYVVGINRCGSDPQLAYPGASVAFGPSGTCVGELGAEEGILRVRLDPAELRRYREKLPFLRDLRCDLFGE